MIRCDKCDQPCGTEAVEWEERHGFSFGPYERFGAEVSDCCGTYTYDDGRAEPAKSAADLFALGIKLAEDYLPSQTREQRERRG